MSAISQQMVTWESLIEVDMVADELAPDEMTAQMYAKKTHLSPSRAAELLKLRYQDGLLTRRKMRNHAWAYRVKA